MRYMYTVSALVLCCFLSGNPASAQTYWPSDATRVITAQDRGVLRDFLIEYRFRQCGQNETPGIERCGLPSSVITRYAPGSFLPEQVNDEVVPPGVVVSLAPTPHGAAYVYAGDNVYLLDILSRRILDVVSLTAE